MSLECVKVDSHKYVTSSGLIVDRPCWLKDLLLTYQWGIDTHYYFYDDLVKAASPIFHLFVYGARMSRLPMKWPIYFSKGLYLYTTASDFQIFIQYSLARR